MEDVFEHIKLDELPAVINEIHRVLKPGKTFRLSLPDYRCDILEERSIKNDNGEIIRDTYVPDHLWFPKYETVKELLSKTNFNNIKFYHYYDENGNSVTDKIDYTLGPIKRTPDYDDRVKEPYRAMSIVVDCIKD